MKRSYVITFCVDQIERDALTKRSSELHTTISDYIRSCLFAYDFLIKSNRTLKEKERKRKEAKEIESKRNPYGGSQTTTMRARARDDEKFLLAVRRFAQRHYFTEAEITAWLDYLDANDWRYKHGGDKVTIRNFHNSLDKFVRVLRQKQTKATNDKLPEKPNMPDEWGYTLAEYTMEALVSDISLTEAKEKLRRKKRHG